MVAVTYLQLSTYMALRIARRIKLNTYYNYVGAIVSVWQGRHHGILVCIVE